MPTRRSSELKCIDEFRENDTDLVAFNFQNISEDGNTWITDEFPKNVYELNSRRNRIQFMAQIFFEYKCGFEAWNRMYKSSVIKKNRLIFAPNKLVFAEDICFNIEYLCCVKRVSVISEYLYFYLHRSSSIMGQQKEQCKIEKYVNIGMFNFNTLKTQKQSNVTLEDYCIFFELLLERMWGKESLENRMLELNKLTEKQRSFCWTMFRQIKKNQKKLLKYLGVKKTLKLELNSSYYMNENHIYRNVIRVLEKI